MKNIKIFPSPKDLAIAAAEEFIRIADQAIQEQGYFSAALSGGKTPKMLYKILADPLNQARLCWNRIHLFFGDERYVPHDHSDSNYRMVKDILINHIDIPARNIFPVQTEGEIHQAAACYETSMRAFFTGDWPRLDLVLLGMGEDGHTASLFPNSTGLQNITNWFIENFAPKRNAWRLTLTKNVINCARNVLVLVSGESKAEMLKKVLYGPVDPIEKPIQLISPQSGQVTWMLDRDAAQKLPKAN